MVGLPPCLLIAVSHHRPRLIIWIVAFIFLHKHFEHKMSQEHQQLPSASVPQYEDHPAARTTAPGCIVFATRDVIQYFYPMCSTVATQV